MMPPLCIEKIFKILKNDINHSSNNSSNLEEGKYILI